MLAQLLRTILHQGSLTLIGPDGRRTVIGSGHPHIVLKLHDRWAALELFLQPDLKLGELYMDRRLTVEEGDIAGLLDLLMRNLAQSRKRSVILTIADQWRKFFRRFAQYNPAGRARAHVAHHYDLSGRLYDLFLDRDRQYSCAYFNAPGETLEEAQIAKKRHIAAKLFLKDEDVQVLDIGCGWGGLALDIARDTGARVKGVTLSEEQIAVARARARSAGLGERCTFDLIDYRALQGKFDRVVSVGMFEHVGVPYYDAFFTKIGDLLTDDGVALIHTIGRSTGPAATNPWISKYIFPGGYTPALSEILPAIERNGLMVADVEVLRLHYGETLKEWRRRFKANWAEVAKVYDERFCRMWEFYLAGAEMSFRREGLVVFQIQLIKRVGTLPITRDYMLEDERSMCFSGTDHMPHSTRAA
ncbi:MAG TPA: cyclopropane-fatty-acyl-phospholipid synthase family protein [Rhizomicrobium sp.]|nr:cyclopropane-fatty-acyl-phospholipid synthase family protein [Rhizomicrobium sp.]